MKNLYTPKSEKQPETESVKVEAEIVPDPPKENHTKIILIVLAIIVLIGLFYFQKLTNDKE